MKNILFLAALLFGLATQAATYTVTNKLDAGAGSLRAAASSVAAGDTIRFDASLLTGGMDIITLGAEIDFGNKGIVIKGLYTATDTLYISGGNTSRIFSFNGAGNVTLDSLVLINGNSVGFTFSGYGGAVLFKDSDTLFINSSIIRDNSAIGDGGGVSSYSYSYSSSVTVTNSTISNNTASGKGGGVSSYSSSSSSSVTVTNSTISNNTANSDGGGVSSSSSSSFSSVTMTNSTISNNTASSYGGGVYSYSSYSSSSVTVTNSTISDNSASSYGGGVYSSSSSFSSVTVANSTISDNSASSYGGGVSSYSSYSSSSVTVTNSTISDNSASTDGGGVFSFSSSSFSTITIGSSIVSNGSNNISNTNPTTIVSNGYNIFNNAPNGSVTTDLTNITASQLNLQPLAFNGGVTQTMLPLAGLAIGMGNPTDFTDAQNVAITDGRREVGAAESCASSNYITQNECTSSFTWTTGNNLTYTNDTTVYHVDPMLNANGCDSVLILNLMFSSTYSDTTATACTDFTWYGTTYTTSDTLTHTLVGANSVGCDSIVTLFLTINQSILLDQIVTTTNSVLCATNTGTTINTTGSEAGIDYYLRDNANDTIVDGPIVGTGSGLTFNTGSLIADMTYNVYAENTVINNALNFDGVDDKVVLPNESDYDFTTDMTVEFWIKASSFDQWDGFVTKGDDSWRVHAHASGTVNFGLNGTGAGANSTTPIDDDTWHHVAATYGSNTAKIYIDGIMENSSPGSGFIDNSSYAVAIGENLQQTGRPLNGSMDEVRIWNVARTSAQINATMSIELVGNEAGLVSYYNFNQGVAGGNNVGLDSLIDLTSNANNGTLTNFALSDITSNWVEKESTCPREMTQTASVTVLPELTGTHTETVCFGESIVVNGITYDANNLSGTELFTNIGANNCDSTVTVNLTIENQIDTTTTTASTTITSNHSSAIATYQWIDCGNNQPISGETNSTYTAAVNGDYAVIITEGNCSDTSACVAIASVGIDELSSFWVSIYPNPNNGEFTISTTLPNATYSLFGLDGKLILSNIKIAQSNPTINLENLENGVYFVTIKNETNQKTVRVVIQK